MDSRKIPLDIDVLTAARERIAWVFDQFPRIYLSGPSGKDSAVMMHLVCEEARKRGRTVGVLYVDLEAQYASTIGFVSAMFAEYGDVIDPHWVALPLNLRNAVSMIQPYWTCWDPDAQGLWVRQPPDIAITDPDHYDFYETEVRAGKRKAPEFEDFVEDFGHWYGQGQACACFVGIRADESLNRWRTIVKRRASMVDGRAYTSWRKEGLVNVYPIYDWRTEDVWTYFGRTGKRYPPLYDAMYKAGLKISQMRICQPYGDDQRRGLKMWHVIEPDTWSRIVGRVAGANYGALYAGKRGNILGNGKVTLPTTHPTWRSYVEYLLNTLPDEEAEHYRNKFAVFLQHYRRKGWLIIPDEADPTEESARKVPSWRRLAKVLLRNDRMCRSIGFSQQSTTQKAYLQYRKTMKQRRKKWKIYAP